ncbi:MAG: hypothetical protein WAZ94_14545 [Phycisphaerales bacterium]
MLTIRPPANAWRPTRHGSEEARRALGLPAGELIMSGHQAEWWHAGILAKRLVLPAGRGAWVVVDQDTNDALGVVYPGPGPTRAVWRAGPEAAEVPTGSLRAVRVGEAPGDATPASAAAGLRDLKRAMGAREGATTLAEQVARAVESLVVERVEGTEHVPLLFATALAGTSRFGELVDRMRREPEACVRAYNAAAAAHPRARLRALTTAGGRVELPLWRLTAGAARSPVYADELRAGEMAGLAPRALLMTGLLRLDLCDLFVHGLGGEVYDPAMEQWFSHWLGENTRLAPTAMVTATLRLAFGVPVMTPEEIDRARWLAHHATHDPRRIGDAGWASERDAAVERVRGATGRAEKRLAYLAMRGVVERYRAARGAALAELAARGEEAARHRARAQVVHDRTWPWVLHGGEALRDLAGRVREAAADGTTGVG